MTVCSASVVLESDLKAYYVFEMMSCLYKWLISWLFMMVSSVFAIMGSREMGL